MIKKTVALLTTSFCLATASYATTVDIDFTSYPINTAFTDQIPGVTFSLIGNPSSAGAPVITSAYGGPGLGNSTTPDYPTAEILDVKFNGLASNITFNFDNYGFSYSGRGASFYSAFDSVGNLLETGSLVGNGGPGSYALLSSNIAELQFNNNTGGFDNWIFALNTLHAEVPEPTTVALLGLGLLGFAASRRKAAKR